MQSSHTLPSRNSMACGQSRRKLCSVSTNGTPRRAAVQYREGDIKGKVLCTWMSSGCNSSHRWSSSAADWCVFFVVFVVFGLVLLLCSFLLCCLCLFCWFCCR